MSTKKVSCRRRMFGSSPLQIAACRTFLSQFPRANAPPKGSITNVESEPVVDRETRFLVDCERAGLRPAVTIVAADGTQLPADVQAIGAINENQQPQPTLGGGTQFQVAYTPTKVGKHDVGRIFAAQRRKKAFVSDHRFWRPRRRSWQCRSGERRR